MVKSKSNIVFSIFIAVIFLASGLLIFVGDGSPSGGDYNGFKIETSLEGYILKFNDKKILFAYHPKELENISVSGSFANLSDVGIVSLVSNSFENFSLSTYFTSSILEDVGKNTITGFSNADHNTNLRTFSCKDSSPSNVVIIFEKSENEKIVVENFCVRVLGNNERIGIRLSHRVIYGILEVID